MARQQIDQQVIVGVGFCPMMAEAQKLIFLKIFLGWRAVRFFWFFPEFREAWDLSSSGFEITLNLRPVSQLEVWAKEVVFAGAVG
jgi:hypothetical protein